MPNANPQPTDDRWPRIYADYSDGLLRAELDYLEKDVETYKALEKVIVRCQHRQRLVREEQSRRAVRNR